MQWPMGEEGSVSGHILIIGGPEITLTNII